MTIEVDKKNITITAKVNVNRGLTFQEILDRTSSEKILVEYDLMYYEPLEGSEGEEVQFAFSKKYGFAFQRVVAKGGRHVRFIKAEGVSIPIESGEGEEEVEFVLFKVGSFMSDPEVVAAREKFGPLSNEYCDNAARAQYSEVVAARKRLGLVQDFAAQAQFNTDHSEFAAKNSLFNEYSNGDYWVEKNGQLLYIYFYHDEGYGPRMRGYNGIHFGEGFLSNVFWFGGRKV